MAQFDHKLFLELSGKGGGPVQALGTAFGMPACLINLGAEALSLLPTPILGAIRGSSANGAARADDVVKAAFSKLRFLHGIIEYDTEDGMFRFVSDSSKSGLDKDEGSLLGSIGAFVGALGAAAGFAGRLYNNYNTTVAQIDSIKDCIESYDNYLKYSGANAADERMRLAGISPEKYQELVSFNFGIDKEELQDALKFRLDALELQRRIDEIIQGRLSNKYPEPVFTNDYTSIVSGTLLQVQPEDVVEVTEEIFRLSFGPPKSKKGKFLLSIDGLFYDSQVSGVIPALLELESRKAVLDPSKNWNLTMDPNLGGRGIPTTLDHLLEYFNTILDPNLLDESNLLKTYYDSDDLLQTLIGQKNRRIYDVSSQIASYENEGYSQILINNLKQVIMSEASYHVSKINKRKKQIELAVKLPVIHGRGQLFLPGNIPINDFTYLDGINTTLNLDRQKTLILDQSEVSGVVLPLQVKYIQPVDSDIANATYQHLVVTKFGLGDIIAEQDPTSQTVSVNSNVVSDGLIALYNFISYNTENNLSGSFSTINSSKLGSRLNCTLHSTYLSSIFNLGVGVPYLHGVTRHSKTSPTEVSSVGSYIKLPEQPELQDLFYSQKGATVELWAHVPQIDGEHYGFGDDYDVSGLYRLILANENTGIQLSTTLTPGGPLVAGSSGTVDGIVFGFTRDRRITLDSAPSNNSVDNSIEHACLFLAPTRSVDSSSVDFINKTFSINGTCNTSSTWFNMKHSIWDASKGVSLSSCGREFCMISLTLSPATNEIKMYCDGVLLTTSSYGDVFGIDSISQSLNIPSTYKTNSFNYSSVAGIEGPTLDTYFTPWIVGGGYTDGNPYGNFLGGNFGGIISGLKGNIGSLKFYSKPLSPEEIASNYNVTKNFFKNIDVPNLMWEPIEFE
jgi:hypothetical protein